MNAKRVIGVWLGVAVVAALIALYVLLYLVKVPGSVAASRTASGVQLYLASVAQSEPTDPNPTWVSFYSVDANSNNYRHDTTFDVPANTLVHVTIYQYDTPTGLRNPYLAQPSGTVGPISIDGRPTSVINPDDTSHVFAIPDLGISVPLPGANPNAKNLCAQAPCGLSDAHETISFTFRSPAKGLYRWQCFVPCGAGYIEGFGGPMQTVGYMDGYIHVV